MAPGALLAGLDSYRKGVGEQKGAYPLYGHGAGLRQARKKKGACCSILDAGGRR